MLTRAPGLPPAMHRSAQPGKGSRRRSGAARYAPRRVAVVLLALLAGPALAASAFDGGDSGGRDLLPADEAFILGAERQADRTIVLHWSIAEDYYLYRDRMEFSLQGGGDASLGEPRYAPATSKDDPFFGQVQVYYQEASVRLPVRGQPRDDARLKVVYQGCNEPAGVCYPPVEKTLALADIAQQGASIGAEASAAGPADGPLRWAVPALFAVALVLALAPATRPVIPMVAGSPTGPRQAARASARLVRRPAGVLLLALALWLAPRLLPTPATMALWAVLLIVSGVQLGALAPAADGWRRLGKGLGTVLLLYGALLLVGAAGGGQGVLQPLEGVFSGRAAGEAQFRPVDDAAELHQRLAVASRTQRPAVLDVHADWCLACRRLQAVTYPDAAVRRAFGDAMLLRADVTADDAGDQGLLARFDVYGPPAVLYFGRDGIERRGHRLTGFEPPGPFARRVEAALTESPS